MKTLPADVIDVIESSFVAEFATISAAGVPIDTPSYCFVADDLSSIGVATGLAYPAKANRARRNPKVGLLIEGMPGQPVISIRGRAAVRDADLRANAIRYLSETGYQAVANAAGVEWSGARAAVWYWTRIIVDIMPEQLLWWDSAETMNGDPHVWTGTIPDSFLSDPAPGGKASPSPSWPQRSWQEIAAGAVGRAAPAHLTVIDEQGWPLPIRCTDYELIGERFRLRVPTGAPWKPTGKATLTFQGLETFVGDIRAAEGDVWFDVERALPQLPMILDNSEVLKPSESTRASLMARLEHELDRRGQSIPELPLEPPQLTRLAQARMDRVTAYDL